VSKFSSLPRLDSLARTAATCIAVLFGQYAPASAANDTPIRPFQVHIPDAALDDLRHRIAETRWPDKETVNDASQGIPLARLQEIARYWETGYDWRKVEARLNALPMFTTEIDGVEIQFIHVKSRNSRALPLLVTHGWPGSLVEQLKIIDPLVNPTAHGGRAEDAFDIVIPSMPGYGFSGKPTAPGWDPDHIARAWGELMTRLGYKHYVAQGGDWGSPISSEMARRKAPGLIGIHISLPAAIPPEVAKALATGGPVPEGLSEQERDTFQASLVGAKKGALSYFAMLSARPQTIGYGVSDSPVFLASWVLVHPGFTKFLLGADPTLTRDDVLDDITLYWLTNTGPSSGRLYWENGGKSPVFSSLWRTSEITLPVAITIFGEDAYRPPESWVRRAYPSLVYFHQTEKGGHFAAWEQPELFAAELRAAFKPLRSAHQ
jgi:pimeloyl-ACP methyl ester carboxylesterase